MLTEKEAQWIALAEDKSLPTNNSGKSTENILLSFSATKSLVCNTDLIRTNIYSTPLKPGPAIFYSAIYCALICAHNISTWCCCDTTIIVISWDLDLYEKCYLLVRANSELKDKLIFCLGELHAMFANVRINGIFIKVSGFEKAW